MTYKQWHPPTIRSILNRKDIPSLAAGDKLYVRKRDPHFPDKVYLYDVEVLENQVAETQVQLLIHYPGQIERTVLYYSGRTPWRSGFIIADFHHAMPTREEIGHFEYRPSAEMRADRY